jgi:hypothetical protein
LHPFDRFEPARSVEIGPRGIGAHAFGKAIQT